MGKSALEEIECVLQDASVQIYHEMQTHIGWSGKDVREFLQSSASAATEKKVNVSGDKVLALDELADKRVEDALKSCSLVAGFASEEREDFVSFGNPTGEYIVVYDPLDGSQNVPVSVSVGFIFGIFKAKSLSEVKHAHEIVASGYALFSTALTFAFCTKTTPVQCKQYDFEDKAWVTFIQDHKIPRKGSTYAINEGNCANWDSTISTFVAQHLRGKSVRWACCMVLDVSRQLLQGGCFLYPEDKKYPKGRLRLVYEAIPLAFLWERAGGVAYLNVDGERTLNSEIPKDVHSRCGVIFLGPEEASNFDRVRSHAPIWAGGQEKEKIKSEQSKETIAVKNEITLLRVALVVGAVFNIALLFRGRS